MSYANISFILLSPIKKNIIFFLFMYLQGIANSLIETYVLDYKLSKFIFLSQIVDVYMLCFLLAIIPRSICKFAVFFFSFIAYFLTIVNIFCVSKFRAKLGPEILNVVIETNARESGEFLDKYVGIDVVWSPVGIILCILALHFLIEMKRNTIRYRIKICVGTIRKLQLTLLKCFVMLIVIGCCVICVSSRVKLVRLLFAPDIESVDHYVDNLAINTPANNLLFALKMHLLATSGLTTLIKTQERIGVDSCCYRSDNIILILGESYIKVHSQLFGYNKETTPRQIARMSEDSKGRLVPFTDVISPSNLTSTVFKNILSLQSIEDTTDWSVSPLFPVIFRKAGYNVTFITNQFVQSLDTDVFNFSGGLFLNDAKLSKLQFDHRNVETHRYDAELLVDYDSLRRYNQIHNLIVFHLAGQHFDFFKRSPDDFKIFSKEDYKYRVDLSIPERQLVADYDNATYYNDYVVDEIIKLFENQNAIVVYVPDHGEECFDEIHRMGRMPSGQYSAAMARQEFRIPFWIWCSDQYVESHPLLFHAILSSADKPFMTDDLSHMLLYLAGIYCSYYEDSRNLLSDNFNVKRIRLIDGKVNYDELVY